ncbi:MAG: shikimate kinase [Lachnospiraceae bacterium]|nr:shikimate kinase [Lachnospiraceae bacterium]MCR4733319.1 shikimate kinase [Lachnospiraceae bacterium]MEE3354714.1 shikimate kinase [Candidatus Weimeria sp.]
MNRKNNIVLIGMPGVGKSTIGVILAKELGYGFMDADLLIQQKTGKLLKEIIEEEGVDGFIRVEEDVNASIEAHHCIIATGGSVVYGAAAMEHLQEIGTVVYIKVDLKTLEERLDNMRNRGVVLREGQTLESLFEERTPLYEKYADVVIDEKDLSPEETLELLLKHLQKLARERY